MATSVLDRYLATLREQSTGRKRPASTSTLSQYKPTTPPPVAPKQLMTVPPEYQQQMANTVFSAPTTPRTADQVFAALGTGANATQRAASTGGGGTTTNAAVGSPGMTGGGFGGSQQTDPFSGFASRYAPGMMGTFYDNPEILAGDVLGSMGYRNPTLTGLIGPEAQTALALNFIMNGAGSGSQKWTDDQAINWAASYLQNMMTPGGRVVDTDLAIRNILGANPANPLGAYLGLLPQGQAGMGVTRDPLTGTLGTSALSPQDQINQYEHLLSAAWAGMNPYWQRAMANVMKSAETGYLGGLTHGAKTSDYGAYLRGTPVARWAGM